MPIIADAGVRRSTRRLRRCADRLHASRSAAGIGTSASDPEEADACRGDSGGPLWVIGPDRNRRQVGVVSGGPTCGFSPTYYTSVEAFIPFIEATTQLQFASFADIALNAHERSIERVAARRDHDRRPGPSSTAPTKPSRGARWRRSSPAPSRW